MFAALAQLNAAEKQRAGAFHQMAAIDTIDRVWMHQHGHQKLSDAELAKCDAALQSDFDSGIMPTYGPGDRGNRVIWWTPRQLRNPGESPWGKAPPAPTMTTGTKKADAT